MNEPRIHLNNKTPYKPLVDSLDSLRQVRRVALQNYFRQLGITDQQHTETWLARSFPVLSILAPVMTTSEKTIEYPGDPMCLYAALSVATAEAHRAYEFPFSTEDPYNDLCPRWGAFPSFEYRQQVEGSGVRPSYAVLNPNTDQTIYDPRVWNAVIQNQFIEHVLQPMQPRVVLISTVSPGFRYAIDIARTIRSHAPNALIVLGGRHIDETVRFNYLTETLDLLNSGPLSAIADGRIPCVFDFVISGDAYYALDCLLKAIALTMDIPQKVATTPQVVSVLRSLVYEYCNTPGRALICGLTETTTDIFPMPGLKIDLSALPNPYQAFAIRSRFPIFTNEDGFVLRTGHLLLVDACPYKCNFCSESVLVMGRMQRFSQEPVARSLERILTCVQYGAEALFFDDSVFLGGNVQQVLELCWALAQAQELAQVHSDPYHQRLVKLQWGAQLTVEFLTSLMTTEKARHLLVAMQSAGCNYIYIGLESLASGVMNKIHKNIQRQNGRTWSDKIWQGLRLLKEVGIRAGTSILFGLDGETKETIEQTIAGVEALIDADLIYMASPNLLTYHPNTEIARLHGRQDSLDYHSATFESRPPYTFFEEAFPEVVSINLSEEDIWLIHQETKHRWGKKRLGAAEAII